MAQDARVQHLLRRAGFGATVAEAAAFSQRGVVATLDALVNYNGTPDDVDASIGQPGYSAVTPSAGASEPFSPSSTINDARQRWLFRMVHSRRPLQEKMALFWHQHFATAYSKIANAVGGATATQLMAAKASEHPAWLRGQLELFRDYALPNFRDLLYEVARDPAMLFWLDGRLNTKARPQENFAREVMELFTIGVGQFIEADVYAGARVFTGWNLQRIGEGRDPLGFFQFFYNGGQHDTSAKTFSFPIYADGSKTIPARSESGGMQEDGVRQRPVAGRFPAMHERDAGARPAVAGRDEPGRQLELARAHRCRLVRQPEIGRRQQRRMRARVAGPGAIRQGEAVREAEGRRDGRHEPGSTNESHAPRGRYAARPVKHGPVAGRDRPRQSWRPSKSS